LVVNRRRKYSAVTLPLAEFVVEDFGVVDEGAVEEAVELFGVDAVGALHFAVQARGAGLDVDVPDALVQDVEVEGDWNSEPLSVWIVWTGKGIRCRT